MFYRLVQGGSLGTWFGIDGPVTYLLEPAYIAFDAQVAAVWNPLRNPNEKEDLFQGRIALILEGFYGRRGYAVCLSAEHSRAYMLVKGYEQTTMGRLVTPADVARSPEARALQDKVLYGWHDGEIRAPRAKPALPAGSALTPSPRRVRTADELEAAEAAPSPSKKAKRKRRDSAGSAGEGRA